MWPKSLHLPSSGTGTHFVRTLLLHPLRRSVRDVSTAAKMNSPWVGYLPILLPDRSPTRPYTSWSKLLSHYSNWWFCCYNSRVLEMLAMPVKLLPYPRRPHTYFPYSRILCTESWERFERNRSLICRVVVLWAGGSHWYYVGKESSSTHGHPYLYVGVHC